MTTRPGMRMRGIVISRRTPTKTDVATMPPAPRGAVPVFPPTPENDLVFRGGRTIADLIFKNFYVGAYWTTPAGQSDRASIDKALAAAMSDANLNNVVRQYFNNHPITSRALESIVVPMDPTAKVAKSDVKRFVTSLFQTGALAGLDFDNTVVNLLLPPRVVLSGDDAAPPARTTAAHAPGLPQDEDDEADSRQGLGGYHGSVHLSGPAQRPVCYAVGAYSAFDAQNGDNGIPIPGWQPWENVVATFYHELNEARTDPDVEDANASGNVGLVGWTSNRDGAEIGDFPIKISGGDLSRVFRKVPLADGSAEVPVQFLYSNAAHGPQGPVRDSLPAAGRFSAMAAPGDHVANSAAVSAATLARFSPPANLADFRTDALRQARSDQLSDLFDQGVRRTQDFLQGQPGQFYNPTRTAPAGTDGTELPILWQGFPKSIERRFGTGTRKAWQMAEQISGTQVARQQVQDEYLEWFVTRDPSSGRITRVDFTCEGPEYWNFLAQNDPDTVLALYRAHVSPDVQMADLFDAGTYDPLNPWNLTRGAMHLIQPNNTLSAEIFIAADATVLRTTVPAI